MATITWRMKLYDLAGNLVSSVDEATSRTWQEALNGIDQAGIGLYTDDPLARTIRPGKHVLKIWRDIDDPLYGISYTRPDPFPDFAGICGSRSRQPGTNIVQFQFYAPLWRLQSRFHLLDHYLTDPLVLDPDNTGPGREEVPATISNLLWKLVDLVNNAWSPDVNETGIGRGASEDVGLITDVYTVAKDSNTWEHFDFILSALGSPDLAPLYQHEDGNNEFMLLNTQLVRGSNRTGAWGVDYPAVILDYTETEDRNLADLGFTEQISPGITANYIRAYGQAGKEAFSQVFETDGGTFGRDVVGPYMKSMRFDSIHTASSLQARGNAEKARTNHPMVIWTPTLSQTNPPYYRNAFWMGDKILLNADKDACYANNIAQRVYQATLAMSDNDVETVTLAIADDFTSKVPETA